MRAIGGSQAGAADQNEAAAKPEQSRPWPRLLGIVLCGALANFAPAQHACATLSSAGGRRHIDAMHAMGARCGAADSVAAAVVRLAWIALPHGLARQQEAWPARAGLLLHAGSQGQSLSERAQAVEYNFAQVAENLLQGQRDVPTVLAAWTISDSHCVKLYQPGVTEMARARASGGDGRPMRALTVGRPL